MKKVLVLYSRCPYPLTDGGKIRAFNNIKMLSEKYDIDLLFINNKITEEAEIKELKKYCNNVYNFDSNKYGFYFNTFKGLIFNRLPLQVNYFYLEKVKKWIDSNINKYDTVFINNLRMAEYAKDKKEINKIIDYVDALSMNYNKALCNSKGIWKLIYRIERKRVLKYEVELSEIIDKKIIISEIDKNYLIEKGASQDIAVISNSAKLYNKSNKKIKKNNLMFLGKMDYEPNVSAMSYFIKEIFPILKTKFKDISLTIVGGSPSKNILDLGKDSSIKVTGFVNSTIPYFQNANLFIAPMISGAGVQNKILEAMSLGKCVITTRIGAEGLENLTGNELVICRNKEELIDKISYFLLNTKEAEKIGENANQYIANNLSYEIIKEKFIKYLEE